MNYIDILTSPIFVLILLLALNVLVVVLYLIEYRKNKQNVGELKKTLALLQQVVNQDSQSIQEEKNFFSDFTRHSEGLEKFEDAKGTAVTVLTKANKQAETMVKEAETLRKKMHQQLLESQARTSLQAQDVIAQAQAQAQQLLGDTKTFHDKAQALLDQGLAANSNEAKELIVKQQDELLKKYEASFEEAYQKYINLLQNMTETAQQSSQKMVQDFLDSVKNDIIKANTQRSDYAEKELTSIKADLASYKAHELAKIEGNIYEILSRASESVIGQAVNFDLHQDLIIKALEQAKREGIFV